MSLEDLRNEIANIRQRVLGRGSPILPRLRLIESLNVQLGEQQALEAMGPRQETIVERSEGNPGIQTGLQDVQSLAMLRVRNLLVKGPLARLSDALLRRVEGPPKEEIPQRRFRG